MNSQSIDSSFTPLQEAILKHQKDVNLALARVSRLNQDKIDCISRIEAQKKQSQQLEADVELLDSKCKEVKDLIDANRKRIADLEASEENYIDQKVISPAIDGVKIIEEANASFNEIILSARRLRSIFMPKEVSLNEIGVQVTLPQSYSDVEMIKHVTESQKKLHSRCEDLANLRAYIPGGNLPRNYISLDILEEKREANRRLSEEYEALVKEQEERNALLQSSVSNGNANGGDENSDFLPNNVNEKSSSLSTQVAAEHWNLISEPGPSSPVAVPVAMETIGTEATNAALSFLDEERVEEVELGPDQSDPVVEY